MRPSTPSLRYVTVPSLFFFLFLIFPSETHRQQNEVACVCASGVYRCVIRSSPQRSNGLPLEMKKGVGGEIRRQGSVEGVRALFPCLLGLFCCRPLSVIIEHPPTDPVICTNFPSKPHFILYETQMGISAFISLLEGLKMVLCWARLGQRQRL